MSRKQHPLETLLSPARMRPYLAATEWHWGRALELYDWNATVSAAFFESVHYLEVGLRNSIDTTLRDVLGNGWLSPTSRVLTARSRSTVRTAVVRAGGPHAAHGKVVAELPFGFWWSLFADEYNRQLWQPALVHAFTGNVRRRRLHTELNEIRRLRNRIAHHEPIHTRDLDADFARVVDVAERLAPALARHILETSRVPGLVLERRD